LKIKNEIPHTHAQRSLGEVGKTRKTQNTTKNILGFRYKENKGAKAPMNGLSIIARAKM